MKYASYKISNQNNPISFGAIALHKCAQKNIQKGVNSALQSLSLPQKPIKNIPLKKLCYPISYTEYLQIKDDPNIKITKVYLDNNF